MAYETGQDTITIWVQATESGEAQAVVDAIERVIREAAPNFEIRSDTPHTGNYSGIIGDQQYFRLYDYSDASAEKGLGPKVHIIKSGTSIPGITPNLHDFLESRLDVDRPSEPKPFKQKKVF